MNKSSQVPSYMVSEVFADAHRTAAFETLCSMLQRSHKYTLPMFDDYYDEVCYLKRHPFDPANPLRQVAFIGSPGVSASIGAFVRHICARPGEPLSELIFWQLPTEMTRTLDNGLKIGHMIYAEARFGEYDSFLVGGMTDFSGEGGGAYNILTGIFALLSEIYHVPISYRSLGSVEQAQAVETEIVTQVAEFRSALGENE